MHLNILQYESAFKKFWFCLDATVHAAKRNVAKNRVQLHFNEQTNEQEPTDIFEFTSIINKRVHVTLFCQTIVANFCLRVSHARKSVCRIQQNPADEKYHERYITPGASIVL